MNSRDRRLLHMAFKEIEGVETASNGEGPDRFLAVYPAGQTHLPVTPVPKPRSSFGEHGDRGGSRDRGRGYGDRGRSRR
jgi:spoIIIJ-associated protein